MSRQILENNASKNSTGAVPNNIPETPNFAKVKSLRDRRHILSRRTDNQCQHNEQWLFIFFHWTLSNSRAITNSTRSLSNIIVRIIYTGIIMSLKCIKDISLSTKIKVSALCVASLISTTSRRPLVFDKSSWACTFTASTVAIDIIRVTRPWSARKTWARARMAYV